MISLISPAKSLNFSSPTHNSQYSTIQFQENHIELLLKVKQLSVANIKTLMKVSPKIAELNYNRFKNYANLPEKQAIFAYDGNVYNNIDTDTFTAANIEFAQNHIRIISGFYGLLKPLDKIKPYRLEMVTKLLDIAPKGLAFYWQKLVTNNLNKELANHQSKFLINLASNEYIATIDTKILKAPLININFKERRNGVLHVIALNAKKARGLMANFIIKNSIDTIMDIKNFNKAGYLYSAKDSTETTMAFIK